MGNLSYICKYNNNNKNNNIMSNRPRIQKQKGLSGIIRKDINALHELTKKADNDLNKVINRRCYKAYLLDNMGFFNLNIFNDNDWIATINAPTTQALRDYCDANDMVCRSLLKTAE